MTPFQQLRVWFRQADSGQRAMTTATGVILVALVSWLVVPADTGAQGSDALSFGQSGVVAPAQEGAVEGASSSVEGAAAPGPVAAVGGPGGPSSGSVGRPTGQAGGDAATAPGAAGTVAEPGAAAAPGGPARRGTRCPPGSGNGVTDKEVRIAITLISIAGSTGNETVNVPSPQTQEDYWRTVIDAINGEGGFGCRKLVPAFYEVNPVNGAEAQQKCLQIANSRPFMALDISLAAVGASDCIPNQKIPMLARYLSKAQLQKYYPYYLSPTGLFDDTIRNGVLSLRQQGYFSAAKRFKKLGVLYGTCVPDPIKIMRSALREAAVPEGSVVEYNLGCPPGGQNNPADLQQAVLTFKNGGVTHVTGAGITDIAGFTRSAAQQQYKPQYVLAEETIAGTAGGGGTLQPDPANFDGAIDVVSGRYGENNTPGYKPSGATARCNAILAKKRHPPVYEQKQGFGGSVCSFLFITQELLDNASQLRGDVLVQALASLGQTDLSYPYGPIDFGVVPRGTPHGAPSWRTVQYTLACKCIRILDATYRPTFRR